MSVGVKGTHNHVANDSGEGITLLDSNLQRYLSSRPASGCYFSAEIGADTGYSIDQLTGCMVMSKREVDELMVNTPITSSSQTRYFSRAS